MKSSELSFTVITTKLQAMRGHLLLDQEDKPITVTMNRQYSYRKGVDRQLGPILVHYVYVIGLESPCS